jgi:hypothetical protein
VGIEKPQSISTGIEKNQNLTAAPVVWITSPPESTKLVLSLHWMITLIHYFRHNLLFKYVHGKDAIEVEASLLGWWLLVHGRNRSSG